MLKFFHIKYLNITKLIANTKYLTGQNLYSNIFHFMFHQLLVIPIDIRNTNIRPFIPKKLSATFTSLPIHLLAGLSFHLINFSHITKPQPPLVSFSHRLNGCYSNFLPQYICSSFLVYPLIYLNILI